MPRLIRGGYQRHHCRQLLKSTGPVWTSCRSRPRYIIRLGGGTQRSPLKSDAQATDREQCAVIRSFAS